MKLKVMAELQEAFVLAGLKATAGDRSFEISGKGLFLLELGQYHVTGTGLVRWKVKVSRQLRNRGVILIRLAPGNEDLKDFLFFPRLLRGRFFWLSDKLIAQGIECKSVKDVSEAICASPKSRPRKHEQP
jgi:hypothetical protein